MTGLLHAAPPIPFQHRDGLIWVKVNAAGQKRPLNFLLDSGAGCTVVDLAVARALRLKLGEKQYVEGVEAGSTAFCASGFAARCGEAKLPGDILALDLAQASEGCHCRIDGLIGLDFFQHRAVQIDFARTEIRLQDRVANRAAQPLRHINDALSIRAQIDGVAKWIRVDTGCSSALEWAPDSRELARQRGSSIAVAQKPPSPLLTRVQLGAARLDRVPTGFHDRRMFRGEDGLLGNGLLSQFRVTIDAEHDEILLEKLSRSLH